MQVFVPIEDAPPDALLAMLVPYRCGFVCEHALREDSPASRAMREEPIPVRGEVRASATR